MDVVACPVDDMKMRDFSRSFRADCEKKKQGFAVTDGYGHNTDGMRV